MIDPPHEIPLGNTNTGRSLWEQFLWPLGFWRVRFVGKKRALLLPPMAVFALAAMIFARLPNANLAHDRGLLDISADLLSMLVGFFVAALGVVMAMPKGPLDVTIASNANPPIFRGKAMTWREFANIMTAYLVFVSLLTYVVATMVMVVHPGVDWASYATARWWVRVIGGGVYAGLFAHVLSVTLFSLFWIAGKLVEAQRQQEKPQRPVKLANTDRAVSARDDISP